MRGRILGGGLAFRRTSGHPIDARCRVAHGQLAAQSHHHVFEGLVIRTALSLRAIPVRRIAAGIAAALCGWVGYAVYSESAARHQIDRRVQALSGQNEQLQGQVNDRQREIGQAQSQGWLEAEARRLGYIKQGEKVYVLTTPGVPLPVGGGIDLKQLPIAPAAGAGSNSSASSAPSDSSAPSATAEPGSTTAPTPSPTPYSFVIPGPR